MRSKRAPTLLVPILALVSCVTALAVFLPAAVNGALARSQLTERTHKQALVGAQAMALTAGKLATSGNTSGLEQALSEFPRRDPLIERILIVDPRGVVVLDTRNELQEKLLESFEGAWGDASSRDVTDASGEAAVQADAPIFVNDETWGLLRCDYSLAPVRELGASSLRTAAFVSVGLLAAGLYLAWMVLRSFRRSLQSLVAVVEKAGKGNLAVRTGLKQSGELGKLVAAIDTLLAQSEKHEQELKDERTGLEERLQVRTQALDDLTKQLDELREKAPAS